jgi:hypothetical protein
VLQNWSRQYDEVKALDHTQTRTLIPWSSSLQLVTILTVLPWLLPTSYKDSKTEQTPWLLVY